MSLYIVDPADIKSVADAIREKTGESGTMTLRDMPEKIAGISGGGGTPSVPGDGKTRIYIRLQEGRTSPMLGCCPKGTVTVDWGDGTQPDILTGTSITSVKWTPTHNYEEAGDYVISLTVEGEMGFHGSSTTNQYSGILRYSSSRDSRNRIYHGAVQKVEIGEGVTSIGTYAFQNCYSLESVVIPEGVTSIGNYAFQYCYALESVVIPKSVTSIGNYTFASCYSLESVVMLEGVVSIGTYAFQFCYSLASAVIPKSVASIGVNAFASCYSLASVGIPEGVTSIDNYTFSSCHSFASVVIPNGVASIGSNAFASCYGVRYYDFTACASVPTLNNTDAFNGIVSDCQMLIPVALYDEWIAATNWATYESYMVAA